MFLEYELGEELSNVRLEILFHNKVRGCLLSFPQRPRSSRENVFMEFLEKTNKIIFKEIVFEIDFSWIRIESELHEILGAYLGGLGDTLDIFS